MMQTEQRLYAVDVIGVIECQKEERQGQGLRQLASVYPKVFQFNCDSNYNSYFSSILFLWFTAHNCYEPKCLFLHLLSESLIYIYITSS